MGKKKLEIRYIDNPKRRTAVFFNRRSGIFKKAHDLTKTCGTKISVILTDLKGNYHAFINDPDMQIYLKNSVLKNKPKTGKIKLYRYSDEDYPFTSLSHIGRECETFGEDDFKKIKLFEGTMSGNKQLGEILGKRKRLKVFGNSLTTLSHSADPPPKPVKHEGGIPRLPGFNQIQSIPRAKRVKLEPISEEREEKMSPDLHIPKEATVIDPDPPGFYQFEKYHLLSLNKIIKDFELNRTARSREFSAYRNDVISGLRAYRKFIGEYLSTGWDSFTADLCAWRYILALYFSDYPEHLRPLSRAFRSIPIDQMIQFVRIRPPSNRLRQELDSGRLVEEDHSQFFMVSSAMDLTRWYSVEYINYLSQIKRLLEVFTLIILGKISVRRDFNLLRETQRIKSGKKFRILKIMTIKKIITIRASWVANFLKIGQQRPQDVEVIKEMRKAQSVNIHITEKTDPSFFKREAVFYHEHGMMQWIRKVDLILDKLLNDMYIYGRSQQLLTEMHTMKGAEKAIELFLKGGTTDEVFEVKYNAREAGGGQELQKAPESGQAPPQTPGQELGGFSRKIDEKGQTAEDPGSLPDKFSLFKDLDSTGVPGGPSSFSGDSGNDESLLDFFDLNGNGGDNRSVFSFDLGAGYNK